MPKISIKAARVNAGLTQKEAARKLRITPNTLASYEKKSSKLTLAMLQKMAELYRIPAEFLK